MSRAGREPAEDLKRRLVAACEEVGLEVVSARMHLMKELATRLLHVEAVVPGWPHNTPTLSIIANVPTSGRWPDTVDIRCVGTDQDPVSLKGPWMKGRSAVPLRELIGQLRDTLQERQLVIAAVKAGVPGPYRFEQSVWDRADPLNLA
jgi:hypothetical protein